jgi:Fe-S-cluster formation regulator IscX/YfhJ
MAFKKGNKAAVGADHTSRKVISQALIAELNTIDPKTKQTRLRNVVLKLIENAEDGDNVAIQHIADRVEGKPTTTVEAGPQLAKMLFAWAE